MRRHKRYVIACMALLLNAPVHAAPPQAFVTGSYAQLLKQQSDKTFVLSFWSLDCPPCNRELALWGAQPKTDVLALVLVSTDTPADTDEIDALLAQYGVADADSWVFAAPAVNLRYEIDRHWRGELPRTYLIERGKVVDAISGVLDEVRLAQWKRRASVSAEIAVQ